MMPSVPSTSPGLAIKRAGLSNMPTDTKNNTANASRMGNASEAARALKLDWPTTMPPRKAPSAMDAPNS
jgi:hypothetical protein